MGEGIVSTIGSSNSHKEVLENPDSISRTVLDKSLDSGTAFSILSIDIADVDIGENIGAGDVRHMDDEVRQEAAAETGDVVCGTMTSGGSESIMMAMMAYTVLTAD